MTRFLTAYKQLLRAEALIAVGFFGGCFFTGFLIGLGRIHGG
jgi:hypothetical protein